MRLTLILIFLIFIPQITHAYIGPALGVGGTILIFLFFLALVLLIFSLIYYPYNFIKKKFLKKKNSDKI